MSMILDIVPPKGKTELPYRIPGLPPRRFDKAPPQALLSQLLPYLLLVAVVLVLGYAWVSRRRRHRRHAALASSGRYKWRSHNHRHGGHARSGSSGSWPSSPAAAYESDSSERIREKEIEKEGHLV